MAIIAVVLFHLNPNWLPGGFIGVDVFFVISGYLITRILLDGVEHDQPIRKFYSRRIVRLFPAYFVMLTACLVASYFWLFPKQSLDFSHSLISALVYLSNVYFSAHINYLTPDTHLLPLLHTWSLSAEAQCYLIFPFVLMCVIKQQRVSPLIAFTALFLLLFGLNLSLTAYNPDIAFFSPSVRFYQFLGGAVLVFLPSHLTISKRLIPLCFISGLLLISIAFIFINRFDVYPGLLSIVPTFGAMLVIFSGANGSNTLSRVLTNAPMQWMGAISYSLYLWHWPVIVFYKIVMGPILSFADSVVVLTISILLACASWYCLENGFRNKINSLSSKSITTAAVIATLSLISFGGVFHFTQGLPDRYSAEQLYFAQTDFSQSTLPPRPTDGCMVYKNRIDAYSEDKCITVEKNKINVLLIGDSHAEHFRRALEDLSDRIRLSVATVSACRPTWPGSGRKTCIDMMDKVYRDFIVKNNFDVVFISARWSMQDINKMQPALLQLKQQVKRIIVIGPVILYAQSLPSLLARYGMQSDGVLWTEKFSHYDKVKLIDLELSQIALDNGVEYISILEMICPDGKCRVLTESNQPVQWDYGHLTYAGASELVRKMALID